MLAPLLYLEQHLHHSSCMNTVARGASFSLESLCGVLVTWHSQLSSNHYFPLPLQGIDMVCVLVI